MALDWSLEVRMAGEDRVAVEIGHPAQMGFLAIAAAANPKASIKEGVGPVLNLQQKIDLLWCLSKLGWTPFSANEVSMLQDGLQAAFDPRSNKELPLPAYFNPEHVSPMLQPMAETLEAASRLLATRQGQEQRY